MVLTSFVLQQRAVTNGLIIGSLIGIGFYVIAWWATSLIIREKKREKPNSILRLSAIIMFFLKFPLTGVALWFAFKYIPIKPFALIGGVAVTQVAILFAGVTKLFNRQ